MTINWIKQCLTIEEEGINIMLKTIRKVSVCPERMHRFQKSEGKN